MYNSIQKVIHYQKGQRFDKDAKKNNDINNIYCNSVIYFWIYEL